jgi:hypothetical protein
MDTDETQILRLAVAVGINVLTARWAARLFKVNPDYGTAAAVGAMLYKSSAPPQVGLAPPQNENLLYQAADLLTRPGSIVVGMVARASAPEIEG